MTEKYGADACLRCLLTKTRILKG